MDLRPYLKSNPQLLAEGIEIIRRKMLTYQPYILADDIEVGEGQNLVNNFDHNYYLTAKSVFDYNTYTPNLDFKLGEQPELGFFRQCNEEYRSTYSYAADQICGHFNGDISSLSFAEIGCNTGINLYNLAVRGARECFGFDWNSFEPVFAWLNKTLNVDVRFRQGVYDNLLHRFEKLEVPEVDVMLNTVFINHQCDPLQFLCYISDRARKGVFLWVDTVMDESCAVHYPPTLIHKLLPHDRPFPLYFNKGVRLSEKLLFLTMARLGFGKVKPVEPFSPSASWQPFMDMFRMYYFERTSEVRSGYWGNSAR